LHIIEEELPEPQPDQVRIKIKATGVSYADLLMREGVHPETPRGEITIGWDIVGIIDKLGANVSEVAQGDTVAALPMLGGYADYICLRPDELTPVPSGLTPAEAVTMVLNYMTAYQMLHRSAKVKPGQRVLIHGAAGGVGTALLELGRLVDLTMYGTASHGSHETVRQFGGTPIDYKQLDFVEEIARLTEDGIDVVFDGIGGPHVWRSFKSVRPGGAVVAYGLTSTLRGGRLSGGLRYRFHGITKPLLYGLAAWCLPGRRKIRPYSIQRLMWSHPDWFREDLTALFELLRDAKIRPLIAAQMPLEHARQAHELLGGGSVTGKIILLCGKQDT
jgi:NADPH2:quinone reductase